MQPITKHFAEHLCQDLTTLAACWYIKLHNGKELAFTEYDEDLIIDGIRYVASSGITTSAIAVNSTLSADNLEITGILDSSLIMEADLLSGHYDHAEVQMFLIDYSNPRNGKLLLQRGFIGEVKVGNGCFAAEIHGLAKLLGGSIGAMYSLQCRANFCDERCGLDKKRYTLVGSITEVGSAVLLYDDTRQEESGRFKDGAILFLSGANQGLSYAVSASCDKNIILALPPPHPICKGDRYEITYGCDKTASTCTNTYHNFVNFRGEPHIPGLSRLLAILPE